MTIGLESASFLNAFSRRDATRLASIVTPGASLDEQTARLVAMREGIDLVIGGSVERDGTGYRLRVRGLNPESGTVVAEASRQAGSKDGVLEAIGDLAKDVRRSLGDVPAEAPGSGAAPETFTAATLEAAHAYTEAQALANAGRDDDAVAMYNRVVTLDPNLGRAYSGLGVSYRRLGRIDDARAAWSKCLSLLDRMTERERYRTLGLYAQQMAGNYEQAIENNRALVERYPGDSTGFNNLAVAYFNTLDFNRALEAGRRAIALNPKRVRYRANEALYAMYATDFDGARRSAERGREAGRRLLPGLPADRHGGNRCGRPRRSPRRVRTHGADRPRRGLGGGGRACRSVALRGSWRRRRGAAHDGDSDRPQRRQHVGSDREDVRARGSAPGSGPDRCRGDAGRTDRRHVTSRHRPRRRSAAAGPVGTPTAGRQAGKRAGGTAAVCTPAPIPASWTVGSRPRPDAATTRSRRFSRRARSPTSGWLA